MSGTLQLACGSGPDYLVHTAAMVSSVLEHRGELGVHVYYLHDPGLDPAKAQTFADWVRAHGAEVTLLAVGPERLEGLPGHIGHLAPAMWYRVFLPELAPELRRVLYLDGDAIAVDSLEPLWATDLGDAAVAAVTNVFDPWDAHHADALQLAAPYFNSGVLLMDLERMRAERSRSQIVEWARARLRARQWGDQDALNVVLGPNRVELHPRWNCMNSFFVYPEEAARTFGHDRAEEARARPGIRHFEGPSVNKPWHLLCERPGAADYLRHRSLTPWPRVRRDGIGVRNAARWAARRLGRRRALA